MKKYFLKDASLLPDLNRKEAEERWQKFVAAAEKAGLDPSAAAPFHEEALRVFSFSEFVASQCLSNPAILSNPELSSRLHAPSSPPRFEHLESLFKKGLLPAPIDDHSLGTTLRKFRHMEMVRIAWRDIAGLADLSETVSDLSNLAELSLHHACSAIHAWLADEYGEPLGESGSPLQLVTVAMGKLGARELNFSSDIDLIFTFPEHGNTSGGTRGRLTCEQFFSRLCRRLISVIGATRADGFVFRVDTRLRPWGDSGPVCMSFDAMEEYYETQGRDWERYAWIKARPVTGIPEHGAELLRRLTPFVYRRYLDYSAFEALRDMKGMIEAETRRKGMESDIKLGAGGIREVEFIVQAFQLLQGGRDAGLRNPRLMEVLPLLAERGILDDGLCTRLQDAYLFLRNTEHRLQEQADRQTQTLPDSDTMRQLLALSLGLENVDRFSDTLNAHRELVHSTFRSLFISQEEDSNEDKARAVWNAVKAGVPQKEKVGLDPELVTLLEEAGYSRPEDAASILYGILSDRNVQAMHEHGRKRLDALMPQVIREAAATEDPVKALSIMADIIGVIARRTVYISMLNENPSAISHMLRLCMASPWIASFIRKRPVVIDELLDPRTLYSPLERDELSELLNTRLRSIPEDDLESQMDELRMLRQAAVMRIAAADITGAIPIMRVSDFLTETAEVITGKVLELSCTQMMKKFGVEPSEAESCTEAGAFLVVAYGKFGGIELGYSSDLDLVFVHGDEHRAPVPSDTANLFFARTGQRIIHIMSTRTSAGILYETDLRLRPGGESGPLVCSMNRLEDYLLHEAWTWELQALIRARPVAGDRELAEKFIQLRKRVLGTERDAAKLREDVCNMRKRLQDAHRPLRKDLFHLKHDRGGIVDIEFLVQYLVLENACRHDELSTWTDNMRILDSLERTGILYKEDADSMKEAYLSYRSTLHRLSLQQRPPEVPAERFRHEIGAITGLWQKIMGCRAL